MKLDFVGIGAEKAGTTTISQLLGEHPQICLSIRKEVKFFAARTNPFVVEIPDDRYPRGLDWYANHFGHCAADSIRGEFSPIYFIDEHAPRRMAADFPEVKLIACLRDPVARAFSAFQMREHRRGPSGMSFGEAVRGEMRFPLVESGMYHKQLRRYLDHFDRSQLFVVVLEDFRRDPEPILSALYRYLGADDSFSPPSLHQRLNRPKSFRMPGLRRLKGFAFERLVESGNAAVLDRLRRLGATEALNRLIYRSETNPPLDSEDANHLRETFADDTAALEELLGRDLGDWASSRRGRADSR